MMSKTFNEAKNYHRDSRTTRKHQQQSPLEQIDNRTNRFKPKKVRENNMYKNLCREGKCAMFEQPASSYRYFFINRTTSMDIVEDLTEYAQVTKEYTIDTESQIRPSPQHPEPALIQIEYVVPRYPSIIVLLETLYLPPIDSHLFGKIKTLCQTILSSNNTINA